MELNSFFDTTDDTGFDLKIIQSFDEENFEYLENILIKLNYESNKQLNEELHRVLNTYINMFINENKELYINYFKTKPSNILWTYYHNNFDNYIILYELCKQCKQFYNYIFRDIHNSNNLCNMINNWIENDLISNYDGITFEKKSFMMVFNYNIFDNKYINEMIELFKNIYNCKNINKINIYKLFFKILQSNIYYTHINITYETLEKCSKINFITIILFICLNILNDINYNNINNTDKNRNGFIIYETDNIDTLLYYLINYSIHVCFIPLYKLKKSYESKLKQSQGIRFLGFSNLSNNYIQKIQNELNLINDLIIHPKINNIIIELYEKMVDIIDKKTLHILNEEIFNSIFYYFDNMIFELNTIMFNNSIYLFFENIINGTYTNNPHLRYQYATLLLLIKRTNDDIFDNSIINIMKYYNEVDYINWTSFEVSSKHTKAIIEVLLKYNMLCDYSYNIKHELERTFIFKICSMGLSSLNEIEDVLNKLNDIFIQRNFDILNYQDNQNISKELCINSAYKFIQPNITQFNTIIKLMEYINSIKNMPNEILNEIISFYINGIKITSNVYYKKILECDNKNTKINSYQIFIDLLIKLFENNENNIHIKEYLFNIYNIKYPDLMNLTKEIENIPYLYHIIQDYSINIKIDIDYPDDFIDPILCTKINDPIMIPEVNSFFDRSSIITHLYTSKTNPFTRNILTEDDVNNYNKLDKIIKQINDFKQRLAEFEKNYKKSS
jgi:hypothetical protein